jgi:hypothetical protein
MMSAETERRLHDAFTAYADIAAERWRSGEESPENAARSATGHRPAVRSLLLAAASVAVVAAVAAFLAQANSPSASHRGSGGAQPSAFTTPTSAIPAWAEKCLPANPKDRLGSAPEYVGLTVPEAFKLARQQWPDDLIIVGAGGSCSAGNTSSVGRVQPVAIILDEQNPDGPLPTGTRIIVAERVTSTWANRSS